MQQWTVVEIVVEIAVAAISVERAIVVVQIYGDIRSSDVGWSRDNISSGDCVGRCGDISNSGIGPIMQVDGYSSNSGIGPTLYVYGYISNSGICPILQVYGYSSSDVGRCRDSISNGLGPIVQVYGYSSRDVGWFGN